MFNLKTIFIFILTLVLGAMLALLATKKSANLPVQRQAFTDPKNSLTADQIEDRRNLSQMVEIVKENVSAKLFGGFNELKLKVKNHSKYNLNIVSVEVEVYKTNGDKYSDEIFHTEEIEAFGEAIINVPPKNRGTEYRTKVVQVRCDELKYDYDEIPR